MKELFISSLILALTIKDHIANFYTKSVFSQDQNPLPGRCNICKEESTTGAQHVALNYKKGTELMTDLKKIYLLKNYSVCERVPLNFDYTFTLDVTNPFTKSSNNS